MVRWNTIWVQCHRWLGLDLIVQGTQSRAQSVRFEVRAELVVEMTRLSAGSQIVRSGGVKGVYGASSQGLHASSRLTGMAHTMANSASMTSGVRAV